MKQVYRFDENGKYIEPVLLGDDEEIEEDCTEKPLPQPNYRPIFNGSEWVETITQEELDEMLNRPQDKTEIEILKERLALSEAAIDFLIMNGGL
ncbi:hypothetical protein CN692_13320 [Bacillus sp. AFS002410]|uniref:hypothetical protein n=1 Tax=Bacillus sp. AFS002410 TaxID=2033481 RepID=UPI000BEF4D39|nr:hypothetical protein [Bacillus sp. AFS002410]PEJ57388.1 hypothetical protein CN692_13320 [Bacillus sp. AFS002410]